jgi:ABC-type branched-subunit amino acid transport system permease subunit
VNSQFGLTMNAVRDDEERAEFFGYRRSVVQIAVFVFSAALAASGGALFAVSEGFVSPSMSGLALSTTTVLWVVLGGRGTFYGPLIALTVLLFTMIFLPKGLTSLPAKIRESRRKRVQV